MALMISLAGVFLTEVTLNLLTSLKEVILSLQMEGTLRFLRVLSHRYQRWQKSEFNMNLGAGDFTNRGDIGFADLSIANTFGGGTARLSIYLCLKLLTISRVAGVEYWQREE